MRDRAATSNARTRVSKDKDAGGVPSCFERRAARLSRRGLRELTCAARLLSMRAGEGGAAQRSEQTSRGERGSNLQVQTIVAIADPLFPIVFNNGKSNSSV